MDPENGIELMDETEHDRMMRELAYLCSDDYDDDEPKRDDLLAGAVDDPDDE